MDDQITKQPEPTSEGKTGKASLIVIGVLILLIVITALYFFISSDQASEVVEVDTVQVELESPAQQISDGPFIDEEILTLNVQSEEGQPYLQSAQTRTTLYFDPSRGGCDAECLDNMVPYTTDARYLIPYDPEAGEYIETIPLENDLYQYAWNGFPLYLALADFEAGQYFGQDYQGRFMISYINEMHNELNSESE